MMKKLEKLKHEINDTEQAQADEGAAGSKME